jgi:membrane protein
MDTVRAALRYSLALLKHIQRRYIADGCSNSAAALTYMSLFALVPLLTVMYAALSMIPAMQSAGDQLQSLIFENFVPSTGQEVQSYLQTFSNQARKLTAAGVAVLAITALLMLRNIEKTFNAIWKTRGNRRGLSSFLLYWAILSLGPFFIGLAFAVSTYLLSLEYMFSQVDVIGIRHYLLPLAPYLLTALAFTLLFAAVPNCQVPIKHAAIGGLLTALAFELAKQLFALIVANSSYQLVYGAFAAIPLFLLWIYLSWLIVLAGAELVQSLSGFDQTASQFPQWLIALGLLELAWQKHQHGRQLSEKELLRSRWLLKQYRIASDQWIPLRNILLDAGLLQSTGNNRYLLGRDLNHYSLYQLAELLGQFPSLTGSPAIETDNWLSRSLSIFQNQHSANQQAMDVSLASLFEGHKSCA